MAQVQTCGPHPCPNLDCDKSLIKRWRECVGGNQQIAREGLSVGYTPEQLGIYNEKGGHGSLYNLLNAWGTYGNTDPACTYDWINGVKRCDKGDVKMAPQPITAQERAEYQYAQNFGEGITGYMNRLQTEELNRSADWRGQQNWERVGAYWRTPNNNGGYTYVDAYNMVVDPSTGQRTGEQYGSQSWQPSFGNFGTTAPGSGGPGGPGGPGGFPPGAPPTGGGGPGGALTLDQRIGQMLGLDQGRQAWELQRDEQNEAERRTADTYLWDLYGDILGVDFNLPGANPWIQNYLAAGIQVPGGGNPDDFAVPRNGTTGPSGPGGNDFPSDDGTPRDPTTSSYISAEDAARLSGAEDPTFSATDPGTAICRDGKVYDPATQKCVGTGTPPPTSGDKVAFCADPKNANTPECRHPRPGPEGEGEVADLYNLYNQFLGQQGALPGGNTLYPPMARQGSYTPTGASFNPSDARTYSLLAAPMSSIMADVDRERDVLQQLLPRGGELDRSLAQSTQGAFGKLAGLRGDLFNTALSGIQGFAGRNPQQGQGSGALGSATNLQGGRESNASNLLQNTLDWQRQQSQNKGSIFGSLLGSLGQLGAAAILKSDVRAKKDIEPTGETLLGFPAYEWTYNKRAGEHLAGQRAFGIMAQDVEKVYPDVILRDRKGTKHIDYSALLRAVDEE